MPLPEPREQEAESGTAGPEPSPELKPSKLDAAPKPLEFLRTPFGGRLLVHKSFLYRQEKAVGDKVYWKCRRHAGLGCRGRAITRGAQATVMRDHCHLPDEDSLQALPEASGDPQAPEGPGGRMEEPCEGVGPWPGPEESEPTPGQVLSKPALEEEEEGPRALPLLTLPPKKRSTLGLGEYLPPMPPFGAGQAGPLEFLRTCYGGSFLVHEHFLYKREKAVGDKVYWTCRDHTLHGCRSRAITQGQRVTVMRSHCHPPDVEGLEARRRQEKAGPDGLGAPEDKPLPAVDSSLCRRDPGPLALSRRRPRKRAKLEEQDLPDLEADPGGPEFLRTPLGGSFLVHNSFLYRREKAAGEKVYWTCRDQARMGCRSRAITQGRRVTVMRGHCHPPDLAGLEALRQREKRPGPAQRESPAGPEFLRTPLGGSFLVHDSFLYRREKAAGEKVYWTCRDQARMGCRSRAITQGQRVMVMRRHCHPPDLAGLEALRQRENLPNLTHWEGPEPTEPLEFLRTSLGGRFLVHDSFLYRKEKAAGGKVYWMCRDQGRTGCRSRAITQGQRVMVMRSHCHPPDLAGLEALRQRERLPGRAPQREPEKTQLLPDAQLGLETASAESQQSDGSTRDSQPDGESQ